MKRFAPALLLTLSACSTVPTWEPYAVEVRAPAIYAADVAACRAYALAKPGGVSVTRIGEKAGVAGSQSLSGAAVNPLVPALGALGGATGEALEELGFTDVTQRRTFVKCLDKKTLADGSALVLEPDPQ